MLVVLSFLFSFTLMLFDLFYETKTKKYAKRFPGPKTLPFIGNGLMFMGSDREFLRKMESCFKEFGERYRTFGGRELFIILSGCNDVEAVLSSNKILEKSSDYKYLDAWLGEGLLTSSENRWRKHRKLITPSFHFSILQQFIPIFDRKTDIFVNRLEEKCNEKPFDIHPFVNLCALDIVNESAMGVSINAQTNIDSQYVKDVETISSMMTDRMRNPFHNTDFVFKWSKAGWNHDAIVKRLHNFTDNVIRERRKTLEDSGIQKYEYNTDSDGVYSSKKTVTFLDLLFLSQAENASLTDQHIREEVDTFMFRGHDTTTSAISFALYLISRHEEIQNKLYEEQAEIFKVNSNRATTYRDLLEMKYLEICMKETLRLYPPVPFIGRAVTEDTEINGLLYPKGSNIVVDIWNMNRNPKVFEEPLKFNPERFQPDAIKQRNAYSTISFSAGPRNCIGQKFAILEIKMAISKVLRHFILKPVPDAEPMQLTANLVLKSFNGIHIVLQKR